MSLIKRVPTYWLFQLFGWGMFVLINVFFAYTFDRFDIKFVYRLLVYLGAGITLSHIMRLAFRILPAESI